MTNPDKTIKDYFQEHLEKQLEQLGDQEEVNKLEVAAEAAEDMLQDKHDCELLYKELPTGTFLTDEGQDLFNKYYAEALECIEKTPIPKKEFQMMNPDKTIKDYVQEHLEKQLAWLGDQEEVNKLKVASDAANDMLQDKHDEELIFKQFNENCWVFTDEGQDLFNKYYAEALEYVEKLPINTRENRLELASKVIDHWDWGDLVSYARDGLMREYKTNLECFIEDWSHHIEGDEEEE